MKTAELDLVGPIIRRPELFFTVFLVITLLLGLQAPTLDFSSDIKQYLPEGFESVEVLNEIFDTWPTESVRILVKADNVAKLNVLREIDETSAKINTDPTDDGSNDGVVHSMSLTYLIKTINAQVKLDPEAAERNALPSKQSTIDFYLSLISEDQLSRFITPDYQYTIVTLTVNTQDFDADTLMENINAAIKDTTATTMVATGDIFIQKAITDLSDYYMKTLLPLAALSVVICLLFIFRSIKKVAIALLPPVFAAIQTFGILGLAGQDMNITMISIGPLIIGFGVAYSIYIINRYTEERMACQDAETAIRNGANKMLIAIFLSAITTIVGFLALTLSDMPTTVVMGIASSVGIALCLLSVMIIIPSLLIILKVDSQINVGHEKRRERGKIRIANIATAKPEMTLIIAVVVSLLALSNIANIQSEFDYEKIIPNNIPEFEDSQKVSSIFESTDMAFIIVTGDVRDPDVLREIESLDADLYGVKGVSQASSIADLMKSSQIKFSLLDLINLLLGKPISIEGGELPESWAEAQAILNSMDPIQREMLVTDDYSKSLVIAGMSSTSSNGDTVSLSEKKATIEALRSVVESHQDGSNVVELSALTGVSILTMDIKDMIMDNQLTTMSFSIFFVLLAIMVIFRSMRLGVVTLIPMLAVIAWNLGTMPVLGVTLNVATVMMTSILMGTGIDYGIQITQRMRQEIANGMDPKEAVRISVQNQGGSMIETCITTIAGFAVVMLVPISVIQGFIGLMALGLIYSCLAAVFVLPAVYLKMIDFGLIKAKGQGEGDDDVYWIYMSRYM